MYKGWKVFYVDIFFLREHVLRPSRDKLERKTGGQK